MEMFVFRVIGQRFVKQFKDLGNVVIVYIVDDKIVPSVSDLITLWPMSIIIQSKFDVPVVPDINKADKISNSTLLEIMSQRSLTIEKNCKYIRERALSSCS